MTDDFDHHDLEDMSLWTAIKSIWWGYAVVAGLVGYTIYVVVT